MRSLSATLVASLTSAKRNVLARLRFDWLTGGKFPSSMIDWTSVLESVSVSRSITSDLPDEAQAVSGGSSAQMTARLRGTFNGQRVVTYLSPYAGVTTRRLGVPVSLDFGLITDAGQELVTHFQGNVTGVDAEAGGGVTVTALDSRERMDKFVTLPVFPATFPDAANRIPGLEAGWVLNYILRANWVWRAPPSRAALVYVASNYGSAYPDISNGLKFALRQDSGLAKLGGPVFAFDSARHGWCLSEQSTARSTYVEAFLTTALGNALPQLNTPASGTNGTVIEIDDFSTSLPAAGTYEVAALFSTSGDLIQFQVTTAGALRCVVTRNGSAATSADIGTITAGTKTYLLLSLDIATTGNATFRARIGGTTFTSAAFALAGTATGRAALSSIRTSIQVAQTATYGQVQVSSETFTQASAVGLFNDDTLVALGGVWRNAVLEQDFNTLVGMPAVEATDPWLLAVEVAAAESGAVLFDEDGTFRFYNRDHMTSGSPVLTLSSSTHIKDLASSEAVGLVRNQVKVTSTPMRPADTSDLETVWSLSELVFLGVGASTVLYANAGCPIYDLDQAGAGVFGSCNSAADGNGTDGTLSFSYTPRLYPDRVEITVTNTSGFAVYLVTGTTASPATRGKPNVTLVGRTLRTPEQWAQIKGGTGAAYSAVRNDGPSQNTWGVQPLDVPDSRWRQANADADALAVYLLARCKDPHPVLRDVPIVGDLRLQLADLVTVQEAAALGLNTAFRVAGLATSLDRSGGLSQTATLRMA